MMDAATLADVGRMCRDNGLWFVSDEIYHGLTYGAASRGPRCGSNTDAVIVNSFSKYYCMTGWAHRLARRARAAGARRRAAGAEPLHLPALPLAGRRARGDGRDRGARGRQGRLRPAHPRRWLLEELRRIRPRRTCTRPTGLSTSTRTFRPSFTNDSLAFSRRLLDEAGVAATPGVDFDPLEGSHYPAPVVSPAPSRSAARGVRRLGAFLRVRAARTLRKSHLPGEAVASSGPWNKGACWVEQFRFPSRE